MANGVDVIPDSEEERHRRNDVIEISSDESESEHEVAVRNTTRPASGKPASRTKFRPPRARRVILSSSSEASEPEEQTFNKGGIIDLTESPPLSPKILPKPTTGTRKLAAKPVQFEPLYADDSDSNQSDADDGAILILDDPKSARKPVRRVQPPQGKGITTTGATKSGSKYVVSDVDSDTPVSSIPAHIFPSVPVAPPTPRAAGRTTKKSHIAAEQEKREKYAQDFFNELNKTVFGNRLPDDTKLIWNPRLLTTAGRAKWHRNREGVEHSEIELATKILDCNEIKERIRNTLAHEMCHQASFQDNPNEGHGKIWKSWAARVMKIRRDIEISTRHNYEINYPFEWKCDKCSKIYGRYSKSIKPDECLCGVCRLGRLVPLFVSRVPKTPKTNAKSRMAATSTRDSPMRGEDLASPIQHRLPGAFPLSLYSDGDLDADIELVASGIATLKF